MSVPADASDEDLHFVRQLGVDWVMTSIKDPASHNAETYLKVRSRVEAAGLKIYRLANSLCHNMPEVTLALPDRDRKIETYLQYIRDLGKAGIYYSTYAHMADGIWSSDRESVRGGASARAFRQGKERWGKWDGKTYSEPLSHGRRYTEDEIWENFIYFISRVVPVAEEAGVFIGIHPDDPPAPNLGGVPRCIFSSFEGYKKALEIASSDHIGMCLCTGCWLEGGPGMGKSLLDTIRYFGEKRKLFKIHFRNVDAPMPDGFVETFADEGYMDMSLDIRALNDIGFDGAIMPDHHPEMIGGRRAAQSFAVGYMRGLLKSVRA